MIEIGKMGNSGRDAMQRILKEMETATGDSADLACCITEEDTPSGYWWRYQPAPHHPDEAITAMIHVTKVVADAEARNSGKTYLVGSTPFPESSLYVFAAGHPDARNAAIDIMVDCPPAGKPAPRRSARGIDDDRQPLCGLDLLVRP
jgi:hypothetical protein